MRKQSVTGDSELIKQINLSIVINIIREKGPISRIEISKISNLNKATVSALMDELLEKKYVIEIGEGKSNGGRKPILVNFNGNAGHVIGIELNVGFMIAVLVNLNADIQWEKTIPVSTGEKEIIDQLLSVIDEIKSIAPASPLGIIGIGVGVSGTVNVKTGTLVFAPNAGLHNIPLKHILESQTGVPTIVDNDCNTSAIGEYYFGAGRGRDQVVLVSITNRGIGTGIFVDGKIFRGYDGFAGEMGHMTINMEGPRCNCGNRGCWELYASPRALTEKFKKIKNAETAASVDEIIELANKDDHDAIAALTQIGEYIGVGLSNIVNTFNPNMIIIRGAIAGAGKWIFNPIYRTLSERCYFFSSTNVELIASHFGKYAASVGAASEIIRQLFYSYEQKL